MTSLIPPAGDDLQPAEVLDQILRKVYEQGVFEADELKYVKDFGEQPQYRMNINEAKAAIERLLQRAELEARKEQVMQDFLSLLNDSNEDEAVLIGWRDGQLAELQQELTEMEK